MIYLLVCVCAVLACYWVGICEASPVNTEKYVRLLEHFFASRMRGNRCLWIWILWVLFLVIYVMLLVNGHSSALWPEGKGNCRRFCMQLVQWLLEQWLWCLADTWRIRSQVHLITGRDRRNSWTGKVHLNQEDSFLSLLSGLYLLHPSILFSLSLSP